MTTEVEEIPVTSMHFYDQKGTFEIELEKAHPVLGEKLTIPVAELNEALSVINLLAGANNPELPKATGVNGTEITVNSNFSENKLTAHWNGGGEAHLMLGKGGFKKLIDATALISEKYFGKETAI
ncbi:MAG: hypothetical protein OXR68_03230 [Alphaproteobacteria bacterium]|nr:hypothetical protein [Alphaproteobacteria bacterium]MDD9919618.1 hypothetical protein [Alphaproteobacteria bacterium]